MKEVPLEVPAEVPGDRQSTKKSFEVLLLDTLPAICRPVETAKTTKKRVSREAEVVGEEIARTRSGRAVRPVRRLGIDP